MAENEANIRKRKSDSEEDLFSYGNTMELAFGKKLKPKNTRNVFAAKRKTFANKDDSSSSDDDDDDEEDDDDEVEDITGIDSDSSCDSDAWKRNQISSSSEDEIEIKDINSKYKTSNKNADDSDLLSPSPPPPVIVTQPTTGSRTTKSIRDLELAIRVLKNDPSSFSPLTIRSESKTDDIIALDSPAREIMVKVMCHGLISKFKMKQNEMFFNLQDKIAEKEKTARDKILLTLSDSTIKGSDTPETAGYSVADIIECVIINDDMETSFAEEDDPNKITIKIQTKEAHSKREYSIYKTDVVEKIINQYCKDQNIKMKGLKIYFDGELIKMNQTPQELDLDDDDILDLVHK